MTRRSWALDLFTRCGTIDKATHEHNERTDVINRAVGVALENLKSHVGNLEHRFQEAQSWANNLLEEQQVALDGWQRALETLENIPARKDVPLLGRPSTPKKDKDRPSGTLRDFVDANEVLQAGSDAATLSPRFANQVRDIEKTVSDIASDTQRLLEKVFSAPTEEENILLEVETFAKKIGSDYEHVLSLPSNQKVLANISRLALNHTQNLLPSLLELSEDIQQGLLRAMQRRSSSERMALQHMRTISFIESRLADASSRLANLDVDGNAFDVIYSVFQMPMVYGSILIESVRRREWSDKIKTDSLTLAEEMAVLRDEEQRRRKKWVKTMGDCISFGDSTTPGIEVNLQGQDDEWPEVNRQEIEAYIDEVRTKHSLSNIADDLFQQFKELDSPTRQQRRRAKAFKEGSVFDLSRSSMLLRGDGNARTLQEEKTKLEEKLKGSESRIRKLEDLLHRQSHLGRPSSGTFGPDFPSSPASPHPDALSRRSSVSSRRVSMTQSPEDRVLVQRIVTLEAELAGERGIVQRMHKEARFERQSISDKYQEAQSTKKDLIGNLEARQREFEEERRYLEAEANRFKLRTEEMEEEMDRLMDRENEKQEAEDRIHQLEVELASAHTTATEEARKASDLNERIQSQLNTESDLQARIGELVNQRKEWDQKNQDNYLALQSAFTHLSPGGSAPTELPGTIKAIEVLSEGLAIHARSAEDSASKAMTNNKELEEKIKQLESELEERTKSSDAHEAELSRTSEELSQLQAKLNDANAELDQQRSRMASLQSQLSEGESGSDELRERVTESEQKHTDLSRQLAAAQSQLDDRQEEWERKFGAASEAKRQALARFDARGIKSYDLSKQLYSQVEKLGKMLEKLGFVILRQDNQLVVQRMSKLSASSTLGESLAQSGIVSIKPDTALLNWVEAENGEEEDTRFSTFVESLAHFDVSVFGDAVVKRMKDIELFARKYQREARIYRDKYHRVQNEAHEKIAYRSFKEGDLALFLPTRNQTIRSWAAFNVAAPHYFLREQDSHKLNDRDWLLARISKIEERVVDLSKSLNGFTPDRQSIGEVSDGASLEDENPFELSDGLRWYLIDAAEEKPGAPATPGISKSTVASTQVDAKGSIRLNRPTDEGTVARTLSKSLDSRRNSSNSKRGTSTPSHHPNDSAIDIVRPADTDADPSSQLREAAPIFDEVRRDLLLGP